MVRADHHDNEMRYWTLLIIILCCAAIAAAQDPLGPSFKPSIDTTCTDYPSNIWITDTLQEVYQTTGSAPTCVNNSFAYSNGSKWALIYSTQNSFADFQVHFHDTGSGTTGYQVTVSSFVQTSPASFTIAAPDATHTDIVPYNEDYINVTATSGVTNASTPVYLSIMQAGLGTTTGHIPDILVPAIDPYFHQTTNAFPETISANNNQSVWIDVHIPPTAPSGWYKGTVTVQKSCTGPYPSTGCTTVATLPILIAVWQWPHSSSMPSTSTLQGVHGVTDNICIGFFGGTGFDSTCGNGWAAPAGSANTAITLLKQQLEVLYLDHRMQDFQPYVVGSPWTSVSTYFAPQLNGTLASCTGCANPILTGATLTTSGWNDNAGSISATGQSWMTEWNSNGWASKIFDYACDEPPNCGGGWAGINTTAQTTHGFTPPMPNLVTTSFSRMTPSVQTTACGTTTCLTNSVDWMVTNVQDLANGEAANLSTYHAYQAGTSNIGTAPSRKWGSYMACDSTHCGAQLTAGSFYMESPSFNIDTTPISHRVEPWFMMFSGQTVELYFEEVACWAGSGLNCGNGGDPWAGINYAGSNEGTNVYPGRTTGNTTGFNNVGVSTPIFLPSMKLNHLRDGMQDYEIMTVLKNNGQATAVASAINSFMNTSAGGTGVNAWSFNNTEAPVPTAFTSDLPDAIVSLGTTMHQITFPVAVYVAQTAGTFSGCTGGACVCNGQTTITPSSITWAAGTTYVMCGTITFGTNATGMTINASGTAVNPILIQFDTNSILQSPQFAGCTDGPGGGNSAAGGAINTGGQSYIVIDGQNTGTIQNTANGNTLANDTCSLLLYINGDYTIVRNLTLKNAYQWPSGAAADNNGTNTGDIYANVTNYLKICNNNINNAALGAEININYAGGVTPGAVETCGTNTFTNGDFDIAYNTWNDHAWVAHFNGAGVPLVYGNELMPPPSWQNWKSTTAHTDGWFFTGNSAATFQPQVFWNYIHGDIQSSSPTGMLFMTDDGVVNSGKGAAVAIYSNIFYGQGSTILCCQGIAFQATSGDPKGPFEIYNNLYINTQYANELYVQNAGTPTIDWRNNIYWLNATSQNAYFYQNQNGGWTFSNIVTVNGNDYFGGRSFGPFGIFISPGSFASWKSACTAGNANLCDASSIISDPQLASEANFNSGATITNGAGFYQTAPSPTIRLGDNLTTKCSTLVGLCTTPPQFFGVNSTCGTGCAARPSTGNWDAGPYQFTGAPAGTLSAPAPLFSWLVPYGTVGP